MNNLGKVFGLVGLLISSEIKAQESVTNNDSSIRIEQVSGVKKICFDTGVILSDGKKIDIFLLSFCRKVDSIIGPVKNNFHRLQEKVSETRKCIPGELKGDLDSTIHDINDKAQMTKVLEELYNSLLIKVKLCLKEYDT